MVFNGSTPEPQVFINKQLFHILPYVQAFGVDGINIRHITDRCFYSLLLRKLSTIHFSTRLFSPNPGHSHLPFHPQNQLTENILGSLSDRSSCRFQPVAQVIANDILKGSIAKGSGGPYLFYLKCCCLISEP